MLKKLAPIHAWLLNRALEAPYQEKSLERDGLWFFDPQEDQTPLFLEELVNTGYLIKTVHVPRSDDALMDSPSFVKGRVGEIRYSVTKNGFTAFCDHFRVTTAETEKIFELIQQRSASYTGDKKRFTLDELWHVYEAVPYEPKVNAV